MFRRDHNEGVSGRNRVVAVGLAMRVNGERTTAFIDRRYAPAMPLRGGNAGGTAVPGCVPESGLDRERLSQLEAGARSHSLGEEALVTG